jgi:hypothetical protein
MEFGLFFNLAVNLDMGGVQVRSVPHRDVMNIAFGVCVIMAFGEAFWLICRNNNDNSYIAGFFPHGLHAWLVNLEAGLVIQLPPMVPYFCCSSLITHFNVDKHGKPYSTAVCLCLTSSSRVLVWNTPVGAGHYRALGKTNRIQHSASFCRWERQGQPCVLQPRVRFSLDAYWPSIHAGRS